MKFSEFQGNEWKGDPPILICHGDRYQSGEGLRKAREALLQDHPDAQVERFEVPETNLSEALDRYQTIGMWGETRVVEVHVEANPQGFWVPKQDRGADEREHLMRLARGEPSGNFLLLRCGMVHNSKWWKELLGLVFEVDATISKKGERAEAKAWLMAEASRRDLQISSDGREALLEKLGLKTGVLDNALTLMELSEEGSKRWGADEIQAFFISDTQSDAFDLAHALARKDLGACYQITDALFDRGKQVVELLGALRYHFRTLILLKTYHPIWGERKTQQTLRLYGDRFSQATRQAAGFSLPRLRQVYNELQRLDTVSKSSYGSERDHFESFVLRVFFGA